MNLMEQPKKEIYFNKPQRLTQLISANITVIVAGRRTGNTDSNTAVLHRRVAKGGATYH